MNLLQKVFLVLFFFGFLSSLYGDYKSHEKGHMSGDYIKPFQMTKEQAKFIKKSEHLWFYDRFRIGAGFRPRYEGIENKDFNKKTNDTKTLATSQTILWFFGDINKYFKFKISIQDTRLWGGSLKASGDANGLTAFTTGAGQDFDTTESDTVPLKNSLDLREAFLDIESLFKGFGIRIGRQIIGFGDGRIFGGRKYNQIGNVFDAIKFSYKYKKFTTTAFLALNTEESSATGIVTHNGRKNGSIDDSYLSGWYNSIKVIDNLMVDFYYFGVYKKYILNPTALSEDTENRLRQRDELHTVGIRLTNKTVSNWLPSGRNFDWSIESAWQGGVTGERIDANWDILEQSFGDQRIYTEKVMYDARFLTVMAGYTFFQRLRFGLQYVHASGDPNRSDSKVAGWEPNFASRRMAGKFPGFIGNGLSGIVYNRNIKDYSAHISYRTKKFGTFIFNPHDYYKDYKQDGYYDNNTKSGKSTENASNDRFDISNIRLGKRIMVEYNFIYQYTFKKYLSIWLGASFAHASDSIRHYRTDPTNEDPLQRYTFKPNARYYFFQLVFVI